MSEGSRTPFNTRCKILGELWMQYRFEKEFEDFVSYNDIGLPLSFMISEDLVRPNELAKSMVDETFDVLLASLKISDDSYESLDDLLMAAPEEK